MLKKIKSLKTMVMDGALFVIASRFMGMDMEYHENPFKNKCTNKILLYNPILICRFHKCGLNNKISFLTLVVNVLQYVYVWVICPCPYCSMGRVKTDVTKQSKELVLAQNVCNIFVSNNVCVAPFMLFVCVFVLLSVGFKRNCWVNGSNEV